MVKTNGKRARDNMESWRPALASTHKGTVGAGGDFSIQA